MQYKIFLSFLVLLGVLISDSVYSQETDIVPFLKEIENGKREDAKKHLAQLEEKSPQDPSVKFLKGVLSENGQEAVEIYFDIVKNHPRSKYADASLYRLYSYYYALGSYETAGNYLIRLKKSYPQSPYIKLAEQKLPSTDEAVTLNSGNTRKEEKKESAQKSYKYTIQAGAFSNAQNAGALKQSFEKSGFETDMKEKTVAGTVFQVIYVGKFETEEEAKSFLQVINSEFNLEGRVININ